MANMEFNQRKIFVTDYTNASRTMLFDIHNLVWDEKIIKALDIPYQMLPEVASSCVYGSTDRSLLEMKYPLLERRRSAGGPFGQCCFTQGKLRIPMVQVAFAYEYRP